MNHRQQLGKRGEQLAAAYLQRQGYMIVQRNWRCPHGELDLVAQQRETLVFVEVRTRRGNRFGTAAESITSTKQQRLITLAEAYLQAEQPAHTSWRIDVITIDSSSTNKLNHFENAIGW